MKSLRLVTWMMVMALLLVSCANGTPEDTATPASSGGSGTIGYPANGQPAVEAPVPTVDSSYPAPDTAAATPTLVPTPLTLRPPADGKANIHGIMTSGTDKKPDITILLLAGTVTATQPGFPPMLKYSEESSPHAVQDKSGLFAFFDIDPGTYGLVIASPLGGVTINDPAVSTPQPFIFTVKAGEDKDLGTLNTP